jgi:galactose mutarotase-like enzyme
LKNLDEKDNMPFTLGKHPAFRLQGRVEDALFGFEGFDGRISLEDMMRESGGRAYKKAGTNCVCYYDSILNRGVEVSSDCFNNFMVWTKSLDSGMFCIEPVTYLPDSEEQYFIDAPHDLLRSEEQRIYPMKIRLLG